MQTVTFHITFVSKNWHKYSVNYHGLLVVVIYLAFATTFC